MLHGVYSLLKYGLDQWLQLQKKDFQVRKTSGQNKTNLAGQLKSKE